MSLASSKLNGSISFDVTYVSEEEASGRMMIQDGIRNPFGSTHAGALIWFADVVATTLALQGQAPTQGMGGFPLAVNLNANLLSNCQSGQLQASARFVKKGRRISTIRTSVLSDTGKTLLDLTSTHMASEPAK